MKRALLVALLLAATGCGREDVELAHDDEVDAAPRDAGDIQIPSPESIEVDPPSPSTAAPAEDRR